MTDPASASPGDVFARERQEHIARIVEEQGRARVERSGGPVRGLGRHDPQGPPRSSRRSVGSSGPTAARSPSTASRPELAFDIRERLQSDEKGRIGAAGAALVHDGESIVMDASTTALSVARHLKARGGWSQLTVITNGLRIASELAGHPGITVLMLGGRVRWEALSVVGQLGDGLFSRINVQKAFLGAAGFTLESGPGRRDRRGGADQALDGRRRARGHRHRRPHQVGARGVRHVLPDRPDQRRPDRRRRARTRWSRPSPRAASRSARSAPSESHAGAPTGRTTSTTTRGPMTAPTPVAAVAPRAELRGISKRFAATQALDDVSLDLLPGEVHALVGENGAGKSTLVKILAGVHQPDSGTIRLDGGARRRSTARPSARALGIAVVHQEPRLFPDLTVAENVFIGHAPSGRLGTIDWGAMRRAAQALFEELDVRFDVGAPVRGLSMADQQLIEIAKALSVEARVLILDEPTASLSAHEVERLFAIVRRLRDRGVVDPVRQPPPRRGLRPVRPGDGLPRRQARHHDRRPPSSPRPTSSGTWSAGP